MSRTLHSVRFTFLLVAAFAFALMPAAAGLAEDDDAPPEQSQADEHRRDGQEVSAQDRQNDGADVEDDENGDGDENDGNGKVDTEENGARTAASEEDRGGSDEANRGTIKIHNVEWALWPPRNEPHPGCDFLISFHGFTAEGATVTFFAWSPTGDQQEMLSSTAAFDPEEAQGNELNAVVEFDLTDSLAALADEGFEPHPQQGWHVKVEADVEETVGGAKQKVFWLDCPLSEEGEQELGFEGEQKEGDEQVLKIEDEQKEEVLGEMLERQKPVAAVEQEQAVAAAQEEAAAPGELPLTGGAAAATLIGFGLMLTSVALRRFMR